jgi:hypothetical protein
MGQYAEDPNPIQNQTHINQTQEVIVYRNPMEKEMWDNYKNNRDMAFAEACVSAFVAFFFCFVFIKVFGGIVGESFIRFGGANWWEKHEKLDKFLTIVGLVSGLISGFFIFSI